MRTSWAQLRRAPSVATPRAVAYSTAVMFAVGGVLAVLSTWLPDGPAVGVGQVRALGAVALVISGALFGVGDRLPRWSFHLVLAWLMVSRGILVSGGGLAAIGYALLYLLVVINAFTACSWLGAWFHLFLALAGTVGTLSMLPGHSWSVTVVLGGVLAALCGFVGRLVRAAGHAEIDVLTGLPNRRGLDRHVDQALSRAQRLDLPVALALLDLDDFKKVNDARGHAAGDQLLCAAAAAWSALLPEGALLARLGGDEFVLLLPGGTCRQVAELLAQGRARLPAGQTSSAGTAQWRRGESASTLLSRADRALYRAKRDDRGGTCHDEGEDAGAPALREQAPAAPSLS